MTLYRFGGIHDPYEMHFLLASTIFIGIGGRERLMNDYYLDALIRCIFVCMHMTYL